MLMGPVELIFIVIVTGIILLVVVGLVFLIVMLVKKSGNNSSTNIPVTDSSSKASEKKEILEMLAKKEISKEEAERKLSELGSPVEDQQQAQSKPKGKKKNGCLIALIIAFILIIPAILLFLFLGWFLVNERKVEADHLKRTILQVEQDKRIHEKAKRKNDRAIEIEVREESSSDK